jgi:hypothetical protein
MVGSYGGSTEWSRAQEAGYEKVQNEFGSLPYNCVSLDKDIKRVSDKLIFERKKSPTPNLQQRAYLEALELKKKSWESVFATKGCRDIIENIRITTNLVEASKSAIKAEQQVLPVNQKDQNLYIGLGAVVMLIGLYIILKK